MMNIDLKRIRLYLGFSKSSLKVTKIKLFLAIPWFTEKWMICKELNYVDTWVFSNVFCTRWYMSAISCWPLKSSLNKKLNSNLFISFSETSPSDFRSICPEVFFNKSVLKNLAKFTRKQMCWSLFLKNLKAWGLELYQKRLQRKCFPVNFDKFSRKFFLQNTFGRLLLRFVHNK